MFGQKQNSKSNRKLYAGLLVLLLVALEAASRYFAPSTPHISEAQTTTKTNATQSLATPAELNKTRETAVAPLAKTPVIRQAKHKSLPPHVPEQKIVKTTVDGKGYSQAPIALTWNDASTANSYTVEISGDFNFESLTYTHEVKTADLEVKKLKKGRYFWRVVAHRPQQADQVSNIGDFILSDSLPRVREPAQSAESTTIVQSQIVTIASPAPIATPEPTPQPSQQPPAQAPVTIAAPTPPSHIGLHLGIGISSVYETITENLSDVVAQYHKTLSPGIRAEAGLEATDNIDIEALYRQVQIHFDNSSIGDKDTKGQWNTIGANIAVGTKHGEKDEWRWKLGAAMEQLPLNLFNGPGTVGLIRNLEFTEIGIGVGYRRNMNPWTRFTIDGNLKYPISASSDGAGAATTVRPQVFFDADIGVDKQIFKNGWLGLHWIGTYRAFNFTYADPIVTNGGNEKFFLSAFELRFDFEF